MKNESAKVKIENFISLILLCITSLTYMICIYVDFKLPINFIKYENILLNWEINYVDEIFLSKQICLLNGNQYVKLTYLDHEKSSSEHIFLCYKRSQMSYFDLINSRYKNYNASLNCTLMDSLQNSIQIDYCRERNIQLFHENSIILLKISSNNFISNIKIKDKFNNETNFKEIGVIEILNKNKIIHKMIILGANYYGYNLNCSELNNRILQKYHRIEKAYDENHDFIYSTCNVILLAAVLLFVFKSLMRKDIIQINNNLEKYLQLNSSIRITRFTNKRDLIQVIKQLETEKIKLTSSLANHEFKCRSVLKKCKENVVDNDCFLTHSIKQREIKEYINVAENAIYENNGYLANLNLAIENNKKNCEEIEHFYQNSQTKLENDKKNVEKIKNKIKKKLIIIKTEQKIRKENLQIYNHIDNNIKNSSSVGNQFNLAIYENNKTGNAVNSNETIILGNTSNTNSKTEINLTKLIEMDMEEDEHQKNGILANVCEKITEMFSLIQVNSKNNFQQFAFSQIDSQLNKFHLLDEKIDFLLTTQHQFNIVLNTLDESEHNLKQSYLESGKNCRKSKRKYESKKKFYNQMIIENKISKEIYKKRLEVEESKMKLCEFNTNNKDICNNIKSYCNKYKEDYKFEENELDDLIILLKTFMEKYY